MLENLYPFRRIIFEKGITFRIPLKNKMKAKLETAYTALMGDFEKVREINSSVGRWFAIARAIISNPDGERDFSIRHFNIGNAGQIAAQMNPETDSLELKIAFISHEKSIVDSIEKMAADDATLSKYEMRRGVDLFDGYEVSFARPVRLN